MTDMDRCWIVGFRYVYFDECVIEKQTFLGKLKGSYAVTAQPAEIRRNTQAKTPTKTPQFLLSNSRYRSKLQFDAFRHI